ncbi:MAG: family 20 glycosylhydrolase [Anditalea sp.]
MEVPGHSSAAIHAYPELSCSGRKIPIYPLLAGSPVPPNDVFCAGNEDTYTFFEEVLEEVTSLFPAPYVHLGGMRYWMVMLVKNGL